MKKSMILTAVLAGSLIVGSAQAAVSDLLDTVGKIQDFNKNITKRKTEIMKVINEIKVSKGADKAEEIIKLTDLGLAFLNDVSVILTSGILGISSVIKMVPSDQVKDAGNKLATLVYLTEADEDARKMTGAIGSSVAIINQMSKNITELRKMLEATKAKAEADAKQKAAEAKALAEGKPAPKPVVAAVAEEDLLF